MVFTEVTVTKEHVFPSKYKQMTMEWPWYVLLNEHVNIYVQAGQLLTY